MEIIIKNYYLSVPFCGYKIVDIKYVANEVTIFKNNNLIASMAVIKFKVDKAVSFYFMHENTPCQFLDGHLTIEQSKFETEIRGWDLSDLKELSNEVPTTFFTTKDTED